MRHSRLLQLLVVVGLLTAMVAAPVGAQPSSDALRGQLQTAEERLQELQMRAAAVVEDYNEATVAAEEASAAVAATGDELEELSGEIEDLLEAAGDHVRLLHKLGPTLELSSIFAAGESAEIGARGAALRRIMDIQRADFEGLEAATTRMEALEARYADQHEQARTHEATVAERNEQVQTTLASFDEEIAELEGRIRAAESREAAEERRRQAAEEAAALRAAEEQAAAQAQADAEAAADTAEEQATTATPATSTGGSDTTSTTSTSGGGSGSTDSSPPPSTRQSAQVAVDKALEQVGKPYQYGSAGPNSFDCSGLTSFAWRHAGVDITRTSRSQWHATSRISRSQLQPGDLVFYSRDGTPGGIGHVAMYIGGGDIVEASRSGVPVRRSSTGLSRNDILGFGRP